MVNFQVEFMGFQEDRLHMIAVERCLLLRFDDLRYLVVGTKEQFVDTLYVYTNMI